MFSFKHSGSFNKIEKFLDSVRNSHYLSMLSDYGKQGVEALRAATPIDSGKTADSWFYEIERDSDRTSIVWKNSNVNQNVNIAVILQYGHGTGTGGYVAGRDYINPAMRPLFDKIANEAWKKVTSA